MRCLVVVPLALVLGCSSGHGAGGHADGGAPDAATAITDGGPVHHADLASAFDFASSNDSGDGTPVRQTCTSHYGTQLSEDHGRLDGYLVSIIAPGDDPQCNGDDSHVHLQISMNGGIYDVAVDIGASGDEISYLVKDVALPDGAWSEGWHTSDALSYTSLGVSSTDFNELSPDDAATTVQSALAQVNHISVFGTGYNSNGMHLVHYESGKDGALVIDPQSATPHLLLFRFQADTF